MYINTYEHLPIEAQKIREIVFMEEQGFHNEFDEIDSYATHLVLYNEKIRLQPAAFSGRNHVKIILSDELQL